MTNHCLNRIPLNDIKKIIEYLYEAEEQHFQNLQSVNGGKNTRNHIFNSVKQIKAWIDNRDIQ